MNEVYERIDELCAARGINITEMCKQSGAARGSLSDLKQGRIKSLSPATLTKIAAELDTSVDYLLGREDTKTPAPEGREDIKTPAPEGRGGEGADAAAAAAAARDDTQRSIAALRRRVDRLRDAYLAGVETLEDYSRGKAALETQIAALEAEQAEAASADPEDLSAGLRQDIRRVLATLRDDSVSTEAKHTAAAGLLQSVIFDRGNNLLRVYYHAAQ